MAVTDGAAVFRSGPFAVDLDNRVVTLDGAGIYLQPKEFHLLLLLVGSAGRVVPRQQLLQEIWGPGHSEDRQYLRVLIWQLRRKLEPGNAPARLILTEPGIGYRLAVLP